MKKIFIASACAFTLCLTSCASKAAPETEAQPEVPELTSEEMAAENQNAEETASTDAEQSDNESGETEEAEETEITSEDFPEPDELEEPDIITLEPVEETVSDEAEENAEEVESEEPPLISDDAETDGVEGDAEAQQANEENTDQTAEGQSSDNAPGAEGDASDIDVVDTIDITQNDVVIVTGSDSDDITAIGGGIDITDDSDSDTDNGKYNDIEKDTTPSRSVTLKKFEYLDVTYPGTGWIYMGLIDNSKDIAYFGRKLGTQDTKFSLQARAAGTKIVHFYRNDPLTGKYLDDYLEVVILAENGSNKNHIEAPEYKLPVQKKETKKSAVDEETSQSEAAAAKPAANEKPAAVKSTAKTTSSNDSGAAQNSAASKSSASAKTSADTETEAYQETSEPVKETETAAQASDSSTLLKEAQVLYNEKEYAAALKKLNQFFEYSTEKRDEALYLKGQILEAKSDVRDIKGSIDAYTTLTKNYPASKLWDSANKRIIYLKRFYLEVR